MVGRSLYTARDTLTSLKLLRRSQFLAHDRRHRQALHPQLQRLPSRHHRAGRIVSRPHHHELVRKHRRHRVMELSDEIPYHNQQISQQQNLHLGFQLVRRSQASLMAAIRLNAEPRMRARFEARWDLRQVEHHRQR